MPPYGKREGQRFLRDIYKENSSGNIPRNTKPKIKMKTIEFEEQTVVFAKDQPEYEPLPAHISKFDPQGTLTCCWKLTFKERAKILFTGIVWHQIWTFGEELQPQKLTIEKPCLFVDPLGGD